MVGLRRGFSKALLLKLLLLESGGVMLRGVLSARDAAVEDMVAAESDRRRFDVAVAKEPAGGV